MNPTDVPAKLSPNPEQSSNRLSQQKSPYLLQHAHNPVYWYPWGEEAFAKARRENKPIFLSVGYSTCHWCHVMAHESFESEEIAAIMNREFVNIKLDREERPDVDRVYMTFVQATTGHGGWPMSVWLTPSLQPFVGGTYFPPEDRYGQPGFGKLLERIAEAWKENHDKITEQGAKIVEALKESQASPPTSTETLDSEVLEKAFDQFSSTFDAQEGGFGNAPKFPRPVTLNFLTRFYAHEVAQVSNLRDEKNETSKVAPQSERALKMDLITLRKMAAGGMHDQLGGGFHRYSVDRFWHVPHFEKMLYDQAQLAIAYLEAFQITGDVQFAGVARDVLDYVSREMTAKDGGFFSAEDADSLVPGAAVSDQANDRFAAANSHLGSNLDDVSSDAQRAPLPKGEHAEGAFYVWTKTETDAALGDAAEIFNFHYGVEPNGNAPAGSDPQDEFRGKNILIQRHTTDETAKHFNQSANEIESSLTASRAKLFSIRARRPRPHLDDKILAGWNGLMISAFARGAQVLNESHYLEMANRAAAFLQTHLYDESNKVLFRSYREGRGEVEGFADDYAFVIQAMLDLYV
ncbi:MAG: hypothetical protein JWO45_863, partial [Spartobacteria bacterium]|nr:hypothetical protein [Spartobacteria bacterium]